MALRLAGCDSSSCHGVDTADSSPPTGLPKLWSCLSRPRGFISGGTSLPGRLCHNELTNIYMVRLPLHGINERAQLSGPAKCPLSTDQTRGMRPLGLSRPATSSRGKVVRSGKGDSTRGSLQISHAVTGTPVPERREAAWLWPISSCPWNDEDGQQDHLARVRIISAKIPSSSTHSHRDAGARICALRAQHAAIGGSGPLRSGDLGYRARRAASSGPEAYVWTSNSVSRGRQTMLACFPDKEPLRSRAETTPRRCCHVPGWLQRRAEFPPSRCFPGGIRPAESHCDCKWRETRAVAVLASRAPLRNSLAPAVAILFCGKVLLLSLLPALYLHPASGL